MAKKKATNHSRVRPLWVVVFLFVSLILYLGCARMAHIWPFNGLVVSPAAKTTSTAASAQDNFKGGDKAFPKNTPDTSARGTDQHGVTSDQVPPSNQWTKSSDGNSIVVYGPAPNSIFVSGDSVSGTATSNTVSYRLSDSTSGLLTSGQASVVNGKFSIKLSFSTSASSGNIEVFNQENPYSSESNNVLIPVKFK